MKYFLTSGIIGVTGVLVLFIYYASVAPVPESPLKKNAPIAETKKTSIVFVGDMMLGRFVETLSLRNNDFSYAFASTSEIFSGADFVFGNFEGAVPKKHEISPIYSYQLSVHENAVKAARTAGINVASLANNHTTDFGKEALAETFSTLKNAGINPVGNGADYCTEVNASKVCFLAWNDTFAPLDLKTISEETAKRKTSDTFLVASVHFGNEYSATGTARQKLVAKTLIDSGADVVIGHHPHVVENMEMYKGKPIFYSLGNFIFDQYFSEETQIGLAVRAEIRDDTVLYELIPIDLHKSRPTRMPPSEAREFLAEKELHETFIIPR